MFCVGLYGKDTTASNNIALHSLLNTINRLRVDLLPMLDCIHPVYLGVIMMIWADLQLHHLHKLFEGRTDPGQLRQRNHFHKSQPTKLLLSMGDKHDIQ